MEKNILCQDALSLGWRCGLYAQSSWVLALKILKYTFRIRDKYKAKHCSNILALTAMAFKTFFCYRITKVCTGIQKLTSHLYTLTTRTDACLLLEWGERGGGEQARWLVQLSQHLSTCMHKGWPPLSWVNPQSKSSRSPDHMGRHRAFAQQEGFLAVRHSTSWVTFGFVQWKPKGNFCSLGCYR